MYTQAIAFLHACKRIHATPGDMEYITGVRALVHGDAWTAQAHGTVVNALAYMYCYRTGMGTGALVRVSMQLAELFYEDANLEVLHMQTSEQLDEWIAQLQQM